MTTIVSPYQFITDLHGNPLDVGFVYIGEYANDPEQYPITVFWDADKTIAVQQPIRTQNGYFSNNGVPAKLFIEEEAFSITAKNKNHLVEWTDLYSSYPKMLGQKATFGSSTVDVLYRLGTIYESAGTEKKQETRPFLHDYRPTVADGSAFNTDGGNLFIGAGSGNFSMKAVPLAELPAGTDYNLQCSHNNGFGLQALGNLTIGYKNVALGNNALRKLTEAHGNTAVGRDANHELTTGNENTSVGFTAGFKVNGAYNTSIGSSACYKNAVGQGNVSVGRKAAFDYTSGNYNITIGEQAAINQTSGDYNTIIGKQVTNNGIVTTSNNTIIGSRITGLQDVNGQVVLASGDGNKYLEINPLGSGKSKLDLVSKDTTAYDLSATDGQADNGSTLVLRSAANVANAITQIAFQSRVNQPWCRIVSWGGASPNLSVITNNVEVARWNSSGDFIQKVNATTPNLSVNNTMTFELTSDTSLKIKVRGSDGVTRSTTLTLA